MAVTRILSCTHMAPIPSSGASCPTKDLGFLREKVAPLRTWLKVIRIRHGFCGVFSSSPIGIGITLDEKNSERYTVGISHAGLGLGEREYYLKKVAPSIQLLRQYEAHIAKIFSMLGEAKPELAAKQIVPFETAICQVALAHRQAQRARADAQRQTRAQLDAMAPSVCVAKQNHRN
jgi:predicted metalloendopeptidase